MPGVGLPQRLRSDNGPPFARTGAGGLSRLAVLLVKTGVTPERIAPGRPQQNGRLERLHLTLLQDTATPPARSLREQLDRFHAFQRLYNEERPHQALANDTEHYAPSPRRFDGVLRQPDYPQGHDVRRVRSTSTPRWPASRSGSRQTTTATGASPTAAPPSASSRIAATV